MAFNIAKGAVYKKLKCVIIMLRIFYNLQSLVIELMQKYGFRLGTKREYFHFDYRPTDPINYFS